MELWIPITIAAAFLQNIRSSLQKHLKSAMGTTGATFVRFGFGVPFALAYWLLLSMVFKLPVSGFSGVFFVWLIVAALAQILATFLLVYLFSFRNFVVGTAYSRTEPAQAALFALIMFGTSFSMGVVVAICISVVGVMLISVARSPITPLSLLTCVTGRTALIGLASGSLFGVAAVGFREAALSLDSPSFLMQASSTLVIAITFQSLVMIGYMLVRERSQFALIRAAWKPSALVGLVGATASFGWFTAFTLQEAAQVKVLAQIEMLFTFAASVFVFKEHINRIEVVGCILITGGILVLLIAG